MKTIYTLLASMALTSALNFSPAILTAQDIKITVGSDDYPGLVIPTQEPATVEYGTVFGNVNVAGGTKSTTLIITNNDSDTPLAIGAPAVLGANPGDFSVSTPLSPLNKGDIAGITITFDPAAVGARTAIITIPSSDPDPGDNPFIINVSGTGVNGFPVATPDLSISSGGKWKAKYNKKTFQTDLKGEIHITNSISTPAGVSSVVVYASKDEYLDDNDPLVTTISTPEITGQISGDTPLRLKFKGSTELQSGILFFHVQPDDSVIDHHQTNNLADKAFGVTVP